MSTQDKKCTVKFRATREAFVSLATVTPDKYKAVHLTETVIGAVGRGNVESLVKIKVGTIVSITQTNLGTVATFGEFDVPITKTNLRDLEIYTDHQNCFARLEEGGYAKSLHFRRPELVVCALDESPVPPISLENVARQLDIAL